MDIVHYLNTPKMKTQLKLKKTISLATAQRWMQVMDYRWGKASDGQYVDGHEHEDVVEYWQLVFSQNGREWDPQCILGLRILKMHEFTQGLACLIHTSLCGTMMNPYFMPMIIERSDGFMLVKLQFHMQKERVPHYSIFHVTLPNRVYTLISCDRFKLLSLCQFSMDLAKT